MNRILSFEPLFRQTVGFDRVSDVLDNFVRQDMHASNYPPYNIEKLSEDAYRISLAVAGFSPADIEITQEKNTLSVRAKVADKESADSAKFLYRGIAKRAFHKTFRLDDYVNVKSAELKDGLLQILLQREIPEEAKPRMIQIESARNASIEVEAAH